jgi:hypothetical protein
MPIMSTTLTRFLQFAAVLANASAGQPCPAGFSECGLGNRFCCSDNGDIEGVSPAFSENCPPPQLFEEEQGSIVCETECCESTGTCAFNATKVALKVTGGTGTAQAGYEDGTPSGNTKRCWFRRSTGCVYGTSPNASDPTSCGMQLTFVVRKLNDEDQSSSIVAALNDAVSSLFTTELVTIGDYPYWKYSVNTGAAKAVVEDNADRLTVEDALALENGGTFTITWGYNITAWSYATFPAVTTPVDIVSRDDSRCYSLPNGKSAGNVYSYENMPHYWTSCIFNCDCEAAPRVEGCTDGGCSGGHQLRGAQHTLALLALSWMLGAVMSM